jgi:hypothetical protein
MKNAIYLVLFVIGMILTSATTVSVMTIRPDKPKSIVVDTMNRIDVQNFTYKYFKKGYIIKIITAPNEVGNCVVVMEKY